MKSDRDIYRFLAGVELFASVMATNEFVRVLMFCCFLAMYLRAEEESKWLGKENWFVDSIDTRTRFIVVSELVNNREERGIRKLLKKAKAKTGNQIEVVTTDGFNLYVNSVKYGFGYNLSKHDYNIVHNVVNASKTGKFNYPIERFHNSLRERTKTMRGFHGSLEAGNSLMRGYIIFYNFIRKHQAINCYPSDLAIPELNLKSDNRWLELIEKSNAKSQ